MNRPSESTSICCSSERLKFMAVCSKAQESFTDNVLLHFGRATEERDLAPVKVVRDQGVAEQATWKLAAPARLARLVHIAQTLRAGHLREHGGHRLLQF